LFHLALYQTTKLEQNKHSPWLRYAGLAGQLLTLLGLSVYAGIRLDEKFQCSPIFIIILPLGVLTTTFFKLIKETNKKNPHDRNKK